MRSGVLVTLGKSVTALFLVGCPTTTTVGSVDAPLPVGEPATARRVFVEALSTGRPDPVWALLGPGPRAQFGSEAAFATWCHRYCAEWLVAALTTDEKPEITVSYGTLRLRGSEGTFGVAEAPHLPTRRSADDALSALGHALSRLSDDTAFDASLRASWQRLADGLVRAVQGGVRVKSGTPLAVDGGRVTVVESSGNWSVSAFETTPPGK